MASFNQVILMGNLVSDPELRVSPKGTSICNFRIAVNRSFKDDSGGSREEVSFFDIEAWNKTAETIAKFMTKGRPIFIQGRLKQDTWVDKESGKNRSKVKIVLENFQFVGSREGGGQGGGAAGGASSGGDEGYDQGPSPERNSPPPRAPSRNTPPPPPQGNIDEDVPF